MAYKVPFVDLPTMFKLMKNELSGEETELRYHDQKYNVGVREADFRKSALEGNQ